MVLSRYDIYFCLILDCKLEITKLYCNYNINIRSLLIMKFKIIFLITKRDIIPIISFHLLIRTCYAIQRQDSIYQKILITFEQIFNEIH